VTIVSELVCRPKVTGTHWAAESWSVLHWQY